MSSNSVTGRSGPGCFGYGCLIATVLFIVVFGGIALYAVNSIRSAVDKYTTTIPSAIVPVATEEVAVSSAQARLSELVSAFNERRVHKVALSETDLRALLNQTSWRNRASVALVGNELKVSFAFPLSLIGDWKAASALVGDIAERQASGMAQGEFSVRNGVVSIKLSHLVLNEHPLEDMARGHASEWLAGAVNSMLDDYLGTEGGAGRRARIRSFEIVKGMAQIELQG
jgi:hypothetical protein